MLPAFLRSKLRRAERGEPTLGMVPVQATLLPDVVTSSRYAALERLYIEACRDLHRLTRLADELRAELPEVEAEHEALRIVAKTARLTLPPAGPAPTPNPKRTAVLIAELLDSVVGFNYEDPVLPPRPTGEAALRRAFSTLAVQARGIWSKAGHLRREIDVLEDRLQHHRQATASILTLLSGKRRAASELTSSAPTPERCGLLQEGLSLRLRPNHIVGVLIAFLSFSILTGILIVNSGVTTGHPLPVVSSAPATAPTVPTAGSRGGR
jgi:hypothetical protein